MSFFVDNLSLEKKENEIKKTYTYQGDIMQYKQMTYIIFFICRCDILDIARLEERESK